MHDARARSERGCGGKELQRASHKDPKGLNKCAWVVHSGGLRISGRAYDEKEGRGEERVVI